MDDSEDERYRAPALDKGLDILELLADGREHSVAELQRKTELEASHLSQHLLVLRRHRLVVSDRRGSFVFYRLAFPQVAELLTVARHLLHDIVTSEGSRVDDLDDLPALAGR